MERKIRAAVLLLSMALSACARKLWQLDPDVRAARDACSQVDEGQRFPCVERQAVDALNPDVCRLANRWIDDMCLQSVYIAAADPAICDQLYLKGVQPTCREYYARPAVDFGTDTEFSVDGEPGRYVVRYQVTITHWGQRAVEDLTAHLVFPEDEGLPGVVELEEMLTAPADVVEPNRGLIYEGEVVWETGRPKKETGTALGAARIRIAWTYENKRWEQFFPPSTEKGPDVFPPP